MQDVKISINGKSLIQLIECLKKNGAIEFKYKDLEIKFTPDYNTDIPAINIGSKRTADEPKSEVDELHDLMLTDPLAYEEALDAKLEREQG